MKKKNVKVCAIQLDSPEQALTMINELIGLVTQSIDGARAFKRLLDEGDLEKLKEGVNLMAPAFTSQLNRIIAKNSPNLPEDVLQTVNEAITEKIGEALQRHNGDMSAAAAEVAGNPKEFKRPVKGSTTFH